MEFAEFIGQPLLFPNDSESYFSTVGMDAAVKQILQQIWKTHGLNGIVLYVPDYSRSELKIRASAGAKGETKNLFSLALSFADGDRTSFAAKVFVEGVPDYSEDSWNDSKFDKQALEVVGVDGEAYGVPLRVDHSKFGVLIAWADHGTLTNLAKAQLQAQCALLISAIAKANRDERRFDLLSELSALLLQCEQTPTLLEVSDQAMSVTLNSGFDRVRLFELDENRKYFRLVSSDDVHKKFDYNVKKRKFSKIPFERGSSPYFDHIVDEISNSNDVGNESSAAGQFAFLFRSSDFGTDPLAQRFDRPSDAPWVVVPIVKSGEMVGYLSLDNIITNRTISSEAIAYVLCVAAVLAAIVANEKKSYEVALSDFKDYLLPIYIPGLKNYPNYNAIDLFFDADDSRPRVFSAPDFMLKSKNLIKIVGNSADAVYNERDLYKKSTSFPDLSQISPEEIDFGLLIQAVHPISEIMESLTDANEQRTDAAFLAQQYADDLMVEYVDRFEPLLDRSNPETHAPFGAGRMFLHQIGISVADFITESSGDFDDLIQLCHENAQRQFMGLNSILDTAIIHQNEPGLNNVI